MSHKSRRPPGEPVVRATGERTGWSVFSRRRRHGGRSALPPPEPPPPHVGPVPPAHDQPWIPRSGLIDRIRRSARRQ